MNSIIIRKIKTSKILGIPCVEDKIIDDILFGILPKLKPVKISRYPLSTYYLIGDITYINITTSHGKCRIICKKTDFFDTLLQRLKLPYITYNQRVIEIQLILGVYLRKHFNLDVGYSVGQLPEDWATKLNSIIKNEINSTNKVI